MMESPAIVLRGEAKSLGLKQYFNGKACPKGHVAARNTASGTCTICTGKNTKTYRNADPQKYKDQYTAYRKLHPEIGAATQKKWRAENPEKHRAASRRYELRYPEKVKAAKQNYYLRNRPASLAKNRAWYEKNREHALAQMAAHAKAHPEKVRANARNRRARERNAPGSHSGDDVLAILAAQRGRCGYCRIKLGDHYHVDHIVALVKGGTNDRRNIQILCRLCNQRKHARDPIDFARIMGRML